MKPMNYDKVKNAIANELDRETKWRNALPPQSGAHNQQADERRDHLRKAWHELDAAHNLLPQSSLEA